MNTSIRLIFLFPLIALIVLTPVLTFIFRRERNWIHFLSIALLVLLLSALGGLFFMADSMVAASSSLLFCGICFVVGVGLSAAVGCCHRSWFSLCLGALFAIGIIVSHFVDLSPVKPYRRFFKGIQDGMTGAEVMAVLHREFPEGGRFPVPVLRSNDPGRLMFFLDPKQGAYNAEGVFVILRDAKVVAKQYQSD